MKKTINLLLLTLFSTAALAQKKTDATVVLNGNVTGDTKGFNQIYFYKGGGKQDSTTIVNGKFKITLPFEGTFPELFYTQYDIKARGGYRPSLVLIDKPGVLNISFKIEDGFKKMQIIGSPTTVSYNSFVQQQDEVYRKVNAEMEKMYSHVSTRPITPGSQPMQAATRSGGSGHGGNNPQSISRDSLTSVYMAELAEHFMKSNPDSHASIYILNGPIKTMVSAEQLEKSFSFLSADVKNSEDGKKFSTYLYGIKNAVAGKVVKNFVLNDAGGKSFSFDQLKGKYVWVDFWASWCGPCKAAFPDMKDIYAKYKDKNFEILGISTDATKAPWLNALNQFKNPWLQIWDDKGVVDQFAVSAYPTSFLIGPDGKILIKEVGFNKEGEIVKKLEEVFN